MFLQSDNRADMRTDHWPAHLWLMCGIASLLCACGGGGESAPAATAPATQAASAGRPVGQSNQQIASLIYSDSQRTPNGFYTETVPAFSGYVATSHLKTRDINSSAVLQYELCSDDFNEARQWSDAANSNSGDNAPLTTTVTTPQYFEFDRLRNSTPQGYLRQRVYRCSYLSRSTVDLLTSNGNAGILNVRPMDAATLRQLGEYLWQFTTYNNFGHAVLLSSNSAATNALTPSLYIASLTRATTPGTCDSINVNAWEHTLNTVTGELVLGITPLFSFQAQEAYGVVSVCAS